MTYFVYLLFFNMYLLNGHEFEQTPDDEGQGKPGMLQSMGSQRIGYD